ncbi:MAG: hypothetical protein ABSG70_11775 [Terriglobales bacterium]|jgi:hypothetical protein
MKKTLEVLLTILVLAGLYSAIPNQASLPDSSGLQAKQAVLLADGSDPMPLCRGKQCTGLE